MQAEERIYDVIIAGAGPAGCTCALALRGSGLRVAIIDKASFPRDKVCGDAIPGRATKTLRRLSPAYAAAFDAFPEKYETASTQLNYQDKSMVFDWKLKAYTCTRMEFDDFLFDLVRKETDTHIYCNTAVGKLSVDDKSVSFYDEKQNIQFSGQAIVGADGAHSAVARQLGRIPMSRKHYVGSVRAYYSGIADTEATKTELFFHKGFLPSYLWVFPLPNNMANVGFGMLSSEIVKRKVDLKKAFYEFIEQTPRLHERMKDAKQESPLEGFGLPLGARRLPISGNRFLLTGDAASLIDPISGDGIGNAMMSGEMAAQQLLNCFEKGDFGAAFTKQYDDRLYKAIGGELKMRFRVQQIVAKMPFLINGAFSAGQNEVLKKMMKQLF